MNSIYREALPEEPTTAIAGTRDLTQLGLYVANVRTVRFAEDPGNSRSGKFFESRVPTSGSTLSGDYILEHEVFEIAIPEPLHGRSHQDHSGMISSQQRSEIFDHQHIGKVVDCLLRFEVLRSEPTSRPGDKPCCKSDENLFMLHTETGRPSSPRIVRGKACDLQA